jgi:glycine betaine/proline transport system ATP-binding protein
MQNELLSLEDEDEDRTIVFITHDMNEAFRMGDRIALMKDGEVVQIGTFNDFFKHPANDYVKDFIADVDRSRILKVRGIMRKVKNALEPTASIEDAKAFMEEKEIDSVYVTDEKNKLLGVVLKEDVEKTRNKTIKALIKDDTYKPVLRNSYIKDVLKELKESDHDIPVIDQKGRLRGVLGYDDVIDALAE